MVAVAGAVFVSASLMASGNPASGAAGPKATSAASATSATSAASVTSARVGSPSPDPSTWTNAQLANELVLAGVDMGSLKKARAWARGGIGGIVLFGKPPRSLGKQLAALRKASPMSRILVSSDEEGGLVQRLGGLLGRLPSARKIGSTKSPAQAGAMAHRYGAAMKRLGVNVSLGPVADVGVPGSYIYGDGRAFSTNPNTVGNYVRAWMGGLSSSGVMSVVKHWPGHGSAANTHIGSGRTPSWSAMLDKDEVPFQAAFAANAPAVMVGHLDVPGLTEPGIPATMSAAALSYLRAAAGPDTLIMTDSLSMGAVTTAMHQTGAQAAVRSLIAGADLALVSTADPLAIARAIEAAINDGRLPREAAIVHASRVLSAQVAWR